MGIELTNDEYSELFDLVYIADWIVYAQHAQADLDNGPYKETIQKVYSAAKEYGHESLLDEEDEEGNVFPTAAYENSGIHEYIDEYEDNHFWRSLASRLAFRDVGSPPNTDDEEKIENYVDAVGQAEEMWLREFELNGLSRITLKKDS